MGVKKKISNKELAYLLYDFNICVLCIVQKIIRIDNGRKEFIAEP